MKQIVFFFFLFAFSDNLKAEPFVAGLNAIDRSHYATAFRSFRPLAEDGIPEAQNNLGFLYQNGLGVKRNYTLALSWYQRAAEQGLPEAQHNLGMLNYFGYGVAQDFTIARRHFLKASEQKLGTSSYMIGLIYFNGDGFQKNLEQARQYFGKAAREGDANGQYMSSYLLLSGEGKIRKEGGYWDRIFSTQTAKEDLFSAWVWAEIAVRNGQSDAYNLVEFLRIQSDFDEKKVEETVGVCINSQYKSCPAI